MTPANIETVYETLAIRLDRIAPEQRTKFLAKLALLLAQDVGDVTKVCARIEEAGENLDP